MDRIERVQFDYYSRTSRAYDAMHLGGDPEHQRALEQMSAFISTMRLCSVLDLGCGTGRGVRHFLARHPGLLAIGVDPVPALLTEAISSNGVPRGALVCSRGRHLPFGDRSFDVACELGVLHHVKEPNAIVKEMMRVARRAVFLSDENRFAYGPMASRIAKLFLCKLGLFGPAYYLKTGGKGYRFSAGDGLAFSYSVYDAFNILAGWADEVFVLPTERMNRKSWLAPLLTSFHVLLCALKEG